jgi:membrane fusion protein, multidrug efflux system
MMETETETATEASRGSRLPAALLLVGILGFTFLLTGCDPDTDTDEPASDPAVELEVWTVGFESLREHRDWSGRLEALRALQLQAPGPARVAAVEVRDGDRVARGDLLVRLAAPELEARRGVLADRLEHLQEELDRWRRLAEAGAAGPAELSEATLRVLEVRENLAAVEADLESYQIRAPAPGQVAALAVGVGSQVDGGQLLLRLDDAETFGVRLTVPAREAAYLEARDQLSLRDDAGNALTVERVAFSPHEHPAFVSADLYLTANGQVVGNGRVGQVDVRWESSEEVLIVPWTAVASDEDGDWVALLTGDPPTIERRFVELGRAHPVGIEVLGGLEEGDRVIRYEPRAHPEGREVEPAEPRS